MTPSPLQSALDERGALVLDGAMATELERHGADLSGGLWSARLLLERPELIAEVHRDYFRAGADVAITASYQASMAGFVRAGLAADDARGLMVRSIELAREARDQFWSAALAREPDLADRRPRPLVATSVGPYGAVLADGSEYRGDYDVSHADLVTFHRERLEVLVEAGVEVLACETIPSLSEAEALLEVIADWPELTAWVSFSARNDREVSDGTAISGCSSALHGAEQVVAVGVNCTAVVHIGGLLHELAGGTDKPLVVYPNSGEIYDAEQQSWVGGRSEIDFGDLAGQWYAGGARLIGGCCRTGPKDISAVSAALQGIRAAGGRTEPGAG
jgi:homocysteine S-methyltransferase